MRDEGNTRGQLVDESAELRRRIAGLEASAPQRQRVRPGIPATRIWLPVASMFVLLCVLVWLNEVADLPRLVLGAPRTPANLREAIAETVVIAGLGVLALLGVIRGIDERKRVEEELRESEERYRHIFERAPIGIGIATLDGRVITANEAMQAITGYSVQELRGINLADTYVDDRETLVAALSRHGSIVDMPVRLKRRDGSTYDALLSVSRIRVGGQDVLHTICQDVTERKRAEEEIKRRNEELAALNAIAATVTSSLDLQEILDRALDKVVEIVGVHMGSMYLLDQQTGELVLATHRGLPEDFAERACILEVSGSLAGQVAQSGEPVVVGDLLGDPRATRGLVSELGTYSFAALPMKSRDKVQGVMHMGSQERHPFNPEEMRLYTAIAHQIGVAVQNARLWNQTKRRLQESTILLEISQALASVLELEELLQMIVDSAVDTIEQAECAVIHLLDDATDELHPRALAGRPRGAVGQERMCIGKGTAGYALERGQAVNVRDVDADPRFVTLEGAHEFKSLLVAPLVAEETRIGTISVTSTQIGAFTAEDERLMVTLASHAAIAVKNAQLFARSEEVAMLEERHRIASDIHDGLAQNLVTLSMKVDLCLRLIGSDPQRTQGILAQAKTLVRENIREIRRSIFTLGFGDLEELEFLPALRKYVDGFEEQNELKVHLSIVGEEARSQLPAPHEHALFRIAQEALNNVRKHANAGNVWIALDLSVPDVVSLTVRDDGLGFDAEVEEMGSPAWPGGFGLAGMRARAERLRGRLVVETEPGSGTEIRAVLPLRTGGAGDAADQGASGR